MCIIKLSGEATDTSAKYKIQGYSKEYSNFLKNDENFDIIARMNISLEECEKYCETIKWGFKKKYWRPITIKIAVM